MIPSFVQLLTNENKKKKDVDKIKCEGKKQPVFLVRDKTQISAISLSIKKRGNAKSEKN